MPNSFAYAVLILWPVVAYILYRRFSPLTATFCVIIGGYLFLPWKVVIDFPLLPAFDKESVSAISAVLGCIFISDQKITFLPKRSLERYLALLFIISPILTVFNNMEPVYRGDEELPGLTFYDGVSASINRCFDLIPFLLALQLVKSHEDHLTVLKLVILSGLWYSLLILFEVRMSPQLHSWVYGFFPHSFAQQVRYEGFRAAVFIGHGLKVAVFVSIVFGITTLLWREKYRVMQVNMFYVVTYLFIVLILCKTLSAYFIGSILFLALRFLPYGINRRIATLLSLVLLFYPLLVTFDIVPYDKIMNLVESIDVDRASSLAVRLFHETQLMELAQEKIILGWGIWGRNRLPDSITDGYWIIVLGTYGAFGYGVFMGLVTLSVVRASKAAKYAKCLNSKHLIIGTALVASVAMINQIPNATMSPLVWLLVGATLGRANNIVKPAKLNSDISRGNY